MLSVLSFEVEVKAHGLILNLKNSQNRYNAELEKELNISFREEHKEFIRKYGLLMGYGVEIAVCGKMENHILWLQLSAL